MYKLATEYEIFTFTSYRQLKEELNHIRARGGNEVLWIEVKGSRYVRDFIMVDGRCTAVYAFEPKIRKAHVASMQDELFPESEPLSQGMS